MWSVPGTTVSLSPVVMQKEVKVSIVRVPTPLACPLPYPLIAVLPVFFPFPSSHFWFTLCCLPRFAFCAGSLRLLFPSTVRVFLHYHSPTCRCISPTYLFYHHLFSYFVVAFIFTFHHVLLRFWFGYVCCYFLRSLRFAHRFSQLYHTVDSRSVIVNHSFVWRFLILFMRLRDTTMRTLYMACLRSFPTPPPALPPLPAVGAHARVWQGAPC